VNHCFHHLFYHVMETGPRRGFLTTSPFALTYSLLSPSTTSTSAEVSHMVERASSSRVTRPVGSLLRQVPPEGPVRVYHQPL